MSHSSASPTPSISSSGTPLGEGSLARPCLPCAWGDVFDRLTILRLKAERFTDAEPLAHVRAELAAVDRIADKATTNAELATLVASLAVANASLWDLEDAFHAQNPAQLFDETFVSLARVIIGQNDARARIKRQISLLLGSELIEEKLYGAD